MDPHCLQGNQNIAYSLVSLQTVWIQISQLLQKLADQDLHSLSCSLLHGLFDIYVSDLFSLAKNSKWFSAVVPAEVIYRYMSRKTEKLDVNLWVFSYLSFFLTFILGAQKNCVIEAVLLSTQNLCLVWEMRKIIFIEALLPRDLLPLCWWFSSKSTNFQSCWDSS